MYAKAAVGAAVLTGFSLVQQAPAPVWTLIPGIAGIIVNGISAHLSRRDLGDGTFEVKARINEGLTLETRQGQSCFGPVREGVPPHIVDSCCGGLAGSHVTVTGGGDRVTITGLPYDCIPLAPWVDGTGTVPYACGDDCIEYQGLSNDEYQGLKNAFESRS